MARKKMSTRGERIDAALTALNTAVGKWCDVARLGQCPCCSAVVEQYEPWVGVDLSLVLGDQDGEPRAMGVVGAEVHARLHRDCAEYEDAFCVAEFGPSGRARTPEAAIREIARAVLSDARHIVRKRHERPERPL